MRDSSSKPALQTGQRGSAEVLNHCTSERERTRTALEKIGWAGGRGAGGERDRAKKRESGGVTGRALNLVYARPAAKRETSEHSQSLTRRRVTQCARACVRTHQYRWPQRVMTGFLAVSMQMLQSNNQVELWPASEELWPASEEV
jgi:hypothetical protein